MAAKLPVNLSHFTQKELEDWISQFDVILCDCDGVLWYYMTAVPGSPEAINKLTEMGKRVYLVTNNSHTSREDMLSKCTMMGFKLQLDSMVTSSYVTAHYLKQIGFRKKVYMIGPKELVRELDEVGIEHIGFGPDPLEMDFYAYALKHFKLEEGVGAVLVAFDANLSYLKIFKAVNYLRDKNVEFYATNADDYFVFPKLTLPEVGSILNAVETGSNRKAKVIAKPSTHLCKVIEEISAPLDPSRTLVIGDSLSTDMIFGKTAGFSTLLVETGTSRMKDVKEVIEKINGDDCDEKLQQMVPDFVIKSLDELYKKLTNKF